MTSELVGNLVARDTHVAGNMMEEDRGEAGTNPGEDCVRKVGVAARNSTEGEDAFYRLFDYISGENAENRVSFC